MIRYLIRKIPSVAAVLVVTSVIAFLLPRLVPGDPAAVAAGPDASAATIAAIRADLGLDRPLLTQYLDWMGGLLTGDLGQSLQYHRPVSELIADRLSSTMELAALAGILLVVVGHRAGCAGRIGPLAVGPAAGRGHQHRAAGRAAVPGGADADPAARGGRAAAADQWRDARCSSIPRSGSST